MKLKYLALIPITVFTLTACTQTEDVKTDEMIVLSPAELDLKIQQARAAERTRIQKELAKQEQQFKVFDEILISQGKEPKFSDYYNKPPTELSAEAVQATAHKKANKTTQNNTNAANTTTESLAWQNRIIPESRKPQSYLIIDGKTYYRCAANSLIPTIATGEPASSATYSENNTELSATLCKASRDKFTMQRLQQKLFDLGYLKSDTLSKEQLIDGIWGLSTLEAVKAYQQKHGLLFGQLTIQTLEHLGIFAPQTPSPFESTQIVKAEIDNSDNKNSEDHTKENTKENSKQKNTTQTDTQNTYAALETKPELKLEPKLELKEKQEEQEQEQQQENKNLPKKQPEIESDSAVKTESQKVTTQTETKPKFSESLALDSKPIFYREVGGAKYYQCQAEVTQANQNAKAISYVLCYNSRDVATITDLQYELYEKGFMPANGMPVGRLISGVMDDKTLAAIDAYQKQNGLLQGDLTIEMLEHLGIFKASEQQTPVVIEVAAEETAVKENTPKDKTPATTSIASTEEIPFEALTVKLAQSDFDARNTVLESKPQVYATVRGFKLWRCRARAVIPELDAEGFLNYGENKAFRATLCKKNRSKPLITRLQTALRDRGYLKPLPPIDRVVIDGIWGINTLTALKQYQQDNGLAYGQLTIESLEHLGVFVSE